MTIDGAGGAVLTGQLLQLSATAFDATGVSLANQSFVWTSGNSSVASVDQTGRVSALAAGQSSITASTAGISGVAAITVAALAATRDTIVTLPQAFLPNVVSVPVGSSVTFVFGGGIAHNAIFRASNPPGNPPDIQIFTNRSFNRTFNARGAFFFDCMVHPGMSGQVIVQ